ncbi:MAG: hypothetical protein PHV78_02330 [Patescibacteria group bacterium]|nr:hypothetical protein [Patescibacteria group bacterium]MDD5121017.1 hypothetical protein [Patescibacteria group bacterium]MDD5221622.1 hypothetical protein [Patescibacteria group bacterium]MDD5396064.1 hypothetical protein [Patescibacteria group bacterium]
MSNNKLSKIDIVSFLKYQSDANHYSHSPSIIDSLPVADRIKKLYQAGSCSKSFYTWANIALGNKSKPALVFLQKDLEGLLRKYFKLARITQCHDYHHCRYMPLYLARPK